MEQHSVPQPITSYEFRLVGDMTLKQFGKLAFGVILALIVYAINPAPGILKWSLVILFTGLGVGMAFLPFQGRPLDVWIISFIRRIYSPTQYVWHMGGKLNIKPSYEQVVDSPTNDQPWVQTQQPVISNQTMVPPSDLDQKSIPQIIPAETELWHENKNPQPVISTPTEPKTEETPDTLYQSPLPADLSAIALAKEEALAKAGQSSLGEVTVGKTTIYSADSPSSPNTQSLIPNTRNTVPPVFNPSLIIPTLPNIPNILGGFTKDTEGKLVEGAIIEVRDANLNPVRAFKTNKLGQFQIATPLPNGIYEVETEKDGLTFDIIKIELNGGILPPFEIIAKSNVVN